MTSHVLLLARTGTSAAPIREMERLRGVDEAGADRVIEDRCPDSRALEALAYQPTDV
jgi:hypothetical protein